MQRHAMFCVDIEIKFKIGSLIHSIVAHTIHSSLLYNVHVPKSSLRHIPIVPLQRKSPFNYQNYSHSFTFSPKRVLKGLFGVLVPNQRFRATRVDGRLDSLGAKIGH